MVCLSSLFEPQGVSHRYSRQGRGYECSGVAVRTDHALDLPARLILVSMAATA